MTEIKQTKLDDIIGKLPDEYKPIAEKYVTVLLNMSLDEITAFLTALVNAGWEDAYKQIVGKMTNTELIKELNNLNNALATLNIAGLEKKKVYQQLMLSILTATLYVARAAVGII